MQGQWTAEGSVAPISAVPLRLTGRQQQEAKQEQLLMGRSGDQDKGVLGTPMGLLSNELLHSPEAPLRPQRGLQELLQPRLQGPRGLLQLLLLSPR